MGLPGEELSQEDMMGLLLELSESSKPTPSILGSLNLHSK